MSPTLKQPSQNRVREGTQGVESQDQFIEQFCQVAISAYQRKLEDSLLFAQDRLRTAVEESLVGVQAWGEEKGAESRPLRFPWGQVFPAGAEGSREAERGAVSADEGVNRGARDHGKGNRPREPQHARGGEPQAGTSGTRPRKQQQKKTYHTPDEKRPEQFREDWCLEGQKQEMAAAVHTGSGELGNRRQLERASNKQVWVVEERGQHCKVYFRSEREFQVAKRKLEEYQKSRKEGRSGAQGSPSDPGGLKGASR